MMRDLKFEMDENEWKELKILKIKVAKTWSEFFHKLVRKRPDILRVFEKLPP